MHREFAAVLDEALDRIAAIQSDAREAAAMRQPPARWPMIVFRSPKGWTGSEGGRRQDRPRARGAHTRCRWPTCATTAQHMAPARELAAQLPRRTSCSTTTAASFAELADFPPKGDRRMSANPHANGGELLRDLVLPDFRDYAVEVEPGKTVGEATRGAGPVPARRDRAQPRQLPPVRARRDRFEPAVTPSSSRPTASSRARSCRPTSTRRTRAA